MEEKMTLSVLKKIISESIVKEISDYYMSSTDPDSPDVNYHLTGKQGEEFQYPQDEYSQEETGESQTQGDEYPVTTFSEPKEVIVGNPGRTIVKGFKRSEEELQQEAKEINKNILILKLQKERLLKEAEKMYVLGEMDEKQYKRISTL